MSIRSILALASGADDDLMVLDKAAELTALRGGRLTVLPTFPSPGVQLALVPAGAVLDPKLVSDLCQTHEALKAEIASRAGAAAANAGVADALHVESSDRGVWEALAVHLPVTDLVMIGPDLADTDLTADLLLKSRTPVFIVRPELRLVPMCVAIAWDGSPSAGRALRAALPLMEGARRIVAIQQLDSLNEERRAMADVGRLAAYLKLHGFDADVDQLAGSGDTGEAIAQAARCSGADLLVCGAYGHWRLAELVLGGVTRSVLKSAWPSAILVH